jgi:hypothetical protein
MGPWVRDVPCRRPQHRSPTKPIRRLGGSESTSPPANGIQELGRADVRPAGVRTPTSTGLRQSSVDRGEASPVETQSARQRSAKNNLLISNICILDRCRGSSFLSCIAIDAGTAGYPVDLLSGYAPDASLGTGTSRGFVSRPAAVDSAFGKSLHRIEIEFSRSRGNIAPGTFGSSDR